MIKHYETKFCSSCGEKIHKDAELCPECGVRQHSVKKKIKNPAIAVVLSFLMMGLGQMYNGQVAKGILMMITAIFFGFLSVIAAMIFGDPSIIYIGTIPLMLLWVYSLYDAYTTAEKINSGEIKL